ncbi:MAG: hypothetical protein SNJ64_02415 [Endomicrobiia bacterium]
MMFLGEKSNIHSLQINKLVPLEILDFNFLNTTHKVNGISLQNYNFAKTGIVYNKIIKNYILGFEMNFYDQSYRYNLQQKETNFLFIKNFSQNINFVYEPQIFFVQENKQNLNYYLINNRLSINYIPKHNIFFGVSFVPLYYNNYHINYYTVKMVTKSLLWSHMNTKISFSRNDQTEKYYYDIEVTKNYGIFGIEISNNKKYYYEYIKNYFIKYPNINFRNFKFSIVDLQDFSIKTTLGSEINNMFIKYNTVEYDTFPTNIFVNNNLNTMYKKDVKYNVITCGLNFGSDKLVLGYNTELVSDSDKIFFVPQQKQEIKFELKNKTIKFSNTFIINDKILINENNDYLSNNIVSSTELEFLLTNEIRFNILYNSTITGKNYLQPDIYLSPNILFGIKLNF